MSLLLLFQASASAGRTLAAESGGYTLSGQAVGTLAGRVLVAGAGNYALSGQGVDLAAARRLTAEAGAYSLAGQDVGLTLTSVNSRVLVAEAGSYSLSGQGVDLRAARRLVAEVGAYGLTGQDVGLTKAGNTSLAPDPGAGGGGVYRRPGSAPISLHRRYALAARAAALAEPFEEPTRPTRRRARKREVVKAALVKTVEIAAEALPAVEASGITPAPVIGSEGVSEALLDLTEALEAAAAARSLAVLRERIEAAREAAERMAAARAEADRLLLIEDDDEAIALLMAA